MAKPTPGDVLKLGPEIAALKASMPKKRWRRFVAYAKSQGHTIQGQLTDVPNALKESTPEALRKQAQEAVSAAYKPVLTELSRREAAAGFLEQKRAADDAIYRTWTSGEMDKLDAQARAADTTLLTQQADIARDLKSSQDAARVDSLQRMAQAPGNVSDPAQSTALDQTTADTRSREQVAAARTHSGEVMKIGEGSRELSRAAMIATAAVREATSTAAHWKTMADIAAGRSQAQTEQAKDIAGMVQDLKAGEVSKAQTVQELALAGAELGVKREGIAADVKAAAKKYALDKAKFRLDRWKAEHADAVAQAKVQLGYDQIKERQGQKAADRALDKWITKYKEKHADGRDANDGGSGGGKGVTDDERETYRTVETVRHLIQRKRANGKTDAQIRQELVSGGFDNVTIDVANDLARNSGVLSPHGVIKARRLGIKHVGYFWEKAPPPQENLGQTGHL